MLLRTAILCLVLAIHIARCAAANGTEETSLTPLHILALLPFPLNASDSAVQPSLSDGFSILPALELAAEGINSRSDVLPGYDVRLTVVNSACDILTYTLTSFVAPVFHGPINISGVVGPGCSHSAIIAAAQLSRKEMALLNFHIASSSVLSDRERYGYSYGVVGSLQSYVKAIVALLHYNGWANVVLLFDESRAFYSGMRESLNTELSRFPNISLEFSAPLFKDYIPLALITNLPNTPRVVLLFTTYEYACRILCLALTDYPMLLFPSYQFVMMETISSDFEVCNVDFYFNKRRYHCSKESIESALEGSIHFHYRLKPKSENATIVSGELYSTYWDHYTTACTIANVPTTEWANTYYDALWSLVLSFNNSFSKLSIPLEYYKFGQRNITDVIAAEIPNVTFQGASGQISFDHERGYSERVVDIFQVVKGQALQVAQYQKNCTLAVKAEARFVANSFEAVENKIPLYATILSFLIVSLAGLLIVALQILSIVYRNYESIKATSPRLTHLVYIGCYLLTVSVIITTFFHSLPSTSINYPAACTIDLWCNLCGITLILATVCAKTWRLYRIFVHYLDPGRMLTDGALLVYILTATGVMGILCLAWSVSSPLRRDEFRMIGRGRDIRVVARCSSNNFYIWYGISFGCVIIIMIATVILAILTRKVKYKLFRTKLVTVFIYSLAGLLGIGIPIYLLLKLQNAPIYAQHLSYTLFIDTILFLCIGLLFVPPAIPLLKKLKENLRGLDTEKMLTT